MSRPLRQWARALGRSTIHPGRLTDRPDGRLTDLYAIAVLALVPLSVAVHTVLPARFTYDSVTIQRIAAGEYTPSEDTSYLYVGRLYEWLGMAHRPWAATLLGLVLAAMALYAALRRARGTVTVPAGALVGLYVVVSSVYLGVYSKDVWVVPVVLVVLLAPRGWRGDAAVVVAVAGYATFLRGYWFLILAVYLALRLVTAQGLHRRRVVLTAVAVVAGVTVLSPALLGVDIQSVRASVNLDRVLSADAATAISSPDIGSGLLGDVLENLVTSVELVVPVPLLLRGTPTYAVYAVAIVFIWTMWFLACAQGPMRLLDGRPVSRADGLAVRAALFALAVVVTQGFFEPDYGSYLRHLTPVLPLVIAASIGRPGSRFVRGPADPSGSRTSSALPPPAPGT